MFTRGNILKLVHTLLNEKGTPIHKKFPEGNFLEGD